MNIYEIDCDVENFQSVYAKTSIAYRPIRLQPQGQAFGSDWVPIDCESENPEDEGYKPNKKAGDFITAMGLGIGFTNRALQFEKKLFRPHGELLPLIVDNEPNKLWWFHCMHVVDALNESGFDRIWMDYPMRGERIGSNELFVVPQLKSTIFCTDAIKRPIEESGLTGLRFRLVWSDEPEGMQILERRRFERMQPASEMRQ
jgi:hypothetical protein